MGMDMVEIVMRVEEFYCITIRDDEAGKVNTVGDLYHLICAELDVMPVEHPEIPAQLPAVSKSERGFLGLRRSVPLPPPADALPWTGQIVWETYVAVLADQQCLRADEILPSSRFGEDLLVS